MNSSLYRAEYFEKNFILRELIISSFFFIFIIIFDEIKRNMCVCVCVYLDNN